ncbi:MAG: acetylxylan esterase, partial [Planctomycetales bacterium]
MVRRHVGIATAVGWIALLAAASAGLAQDAAREDDAEDLTVLPRDLDGHGMMARWLRAEAHAALEKRKAAYERLETPEDIAAWQTARREYFLKQLGELPERAPLNARVVGRLPGDGFRVEKVIYDSRPSHAVTAILFLPDAEGPHPAVIIPCGHTANGKAAGAYQQLARLHALHGIAALVYDPIGQGERYQILDDAGKPRFKSTTEHTLVGTSAIPLGWNCASFRVWDGIRSLDYLASRDDIDADRLGCTGNSGGGTLTEYLMAIDPRIVCAAPGSCVTTFARRLDSIGPGDAEQNIFGQIAFGLDHADYTIMRAPRPTLLLAGTQDYIDIRGSWEIHREANRIYTRLGHPERIDLVEHDGPHGYQQPLREAAVSWMLRWLKNEDRR